MPCHKPRKKQEKEQKDQSSLSLKDYLRELSLIRPSVQQDPSVEKNALARLQIHMEIIVEHVFPFLPFFVLITRITRVSKEWHLAVWEKYLMNASISRLAGRFGKCMKKTFCFSKLGAEYEKIPILLPSYDDHMMCEKCKGMFKIEPIVLIGEDSASKLNEKQNNTRRLQTKAPSNDPLKSYRKSLLPFTLEQDVDIRSKELSDLDSFKKYVVTGMRSCVNFYKLSKRVPVGEYSFSEVFVDALLSNKENFREVLFSNKIKKDIKKQILSPKHMETAYIGTISWITREIMSAFYILFQYRHHSTKYASMFDVVPTNSPSNLKMFLREKRLCLSKYEDGSHFAHTIKGCYSQLIDTIYGVDIMNEAGKLVAFVGWRVVKYDTVYK